MANQELFDFDTAIEDGFAVLFMDAGLKTYSPRMAVEFQKERPRVEFMFRSGASKKSYGPAGFTKFNASWFGELQANIITASGDSTGLDSSVAHRQYRAMVRYQMMSNRPTNEGGMLDGINGTRPADLEPITLGYGVTARTISSGDQYLLYHKIQNIVETGTTPTYSTDKGFEESSLVYSVEFGIDGAAWSELANNP